ncbi:MAG: hypothetical protein RXP97_05790 [Nitrososphaeria archaeon]
MAGLSSWVIADAMEDRCGRKPSHSGLAARVRFGQVDHTAEGEEARRCGLERGRGEGGRPGGLRVCRHQCGYRGAPRDKGVLVQWSRSSTDALLFLSRVLGARTNRLLFVVEGGPWYSWAFRELGLEHCRGAFGDRSGVERFFGSLKRRTRVFFKDINTGRSRIASLDRIVNVFFLYYNGPRFQ